MTKAEREELLDKVKQERDGQGVSSSFQPAIFKDDDDEREQRWFRFIERERQCTNSKKDAGAGGTTT